MNDHVRVQWTVFPLLALDRLAIALSGQNNTRKSAVDWNGLVVATRLAHDVQRGCFCRQLSGRDDDTRHLDEVTQRGSLVKERGIRDKEK